MQRFERNHPAAILQIWVMQIKAWVLPLFVLFLSSGRESGPAIWIRLALVAAVLLLLGAYSVFRWMHRRFSIEGGILHFQDGVFIRKSREIPISAIQTVNLSRSPLQRLFGTTEIKVDTGHVGGNEAEVTVIVSMSRAIELEAMLAGEHRSEFRSEHRSDFQSEQRIGRRSASLSETGLPAGAVEKNPSDVELSVGSPRENEKRASAPRFSHTVTSGSLLMAGITSNAVFAGIALLVSAWSMLDDLVGSLFPHLGEELVIGAENAFRAQQQMGALILFILVLICGYAVVSSCAAAIGFLIRWYGFRVERDEDTLHLSFGLISLKQYHLPIQRIHVVHIRQTPMRRLLGTCSVHVESAGYGNEKGEVNLLIPYMRQCDAADLISRMLPDLSANPQWIHPPKRALRRFLLQYLFLPLGVALPITFLVPHGMWSLAALPIITLAAFLNYRTTGCSLDGQVLSLQRGGFWTTHTRIRLRGIQAITAESSGFLRRARLFSLTVAYRGNTMGSTATASYLDNAHQQALLDLMR